MTETNRPQDLAVQNRCVEGRAWTWAVQGPSGGCAVAVQVLTNRHSGNARKEGIAN